MKARVLVRPKEGILDPQGKAVERALPALGFEGIGNVHVGRMVELEADDPERLGERIGVVGLELDQASHPHVGDAIEAQRRESPLDRLPLRVEDALLRPDQDSRFQKLCPVMRS